MSHPHSFFIDMVAALHMHSLNVFKECVIAKYPEYPGPQNWAVAIREALSESEDPILQQCNTVGEKPQTTSEGYFNSRGKNGIKLYTHYVLSIGKPFVRIHCLLYFAIIGSMVLILQMMKLRVREA